MQVTAIVLTVVAAHTDGVLTWTAPVSSVDEPSASRDCCASLLACFPQTVSMLSSLHSSNCADDSDDSDTEAAASVAAPSTINGVKQHFRGIIAVEPATISSIVTCAFHGCLPGEHIVVSLAIRHPRTGLYLTAPSCLTSLTALYTSGATFISTNTTATGGGRNPVEQHAHLRRTLVTGSLNRIVAPANAIAETCAAVATHAPCLEPIHSLRARKYMSIYLDETRLFAIV